MNIEQAYSNLVQVLTHSRISMPNGPLTALEHQGLNNGLKLLYERAKSNVEVEETVEEVK